MDESKNESEKSKALKENESYKHDCERNNNQNRTCSECEHEKSEIESQSKIEKIRIYEDKLNSSDQMLIGEIEIGDHDSEEMEIEFLANNNGLLKVTLTNILNNRNLYSLFKYIFQQEFQL